ncbi:MAG: glycosyl hydrolase family 18 [Lachnospiraceae bacterium]|nr:glycosyl hydrolase family 18 [Lachnospiraceae bacterium]
MKKQKKIWIALIATLLVVLLLVAGFLIKKYSPSKEKADLKAYFQITAESELPIILEEEQLESKARYEGGHVYVDYQTLHDSIDERFYWDSNESKLLYTTPEDTYVAEPGSESYYAGRKKITADVGEILRLEGDAVWVNMDYVMLHSRAEYELDKDPDRIVVQKRDRKVSTVKVEKDTQVRLRGGIKSPILTEVKQGQQLVVMDTLENWTKVATADGFRGFIQNSKISDKKGTKLKLSKKAPEYRHCMKDGTVLMAWHQVTSSYANTQVANVLAKTKGVTVVSPTWFYLTDSKGSIGSLASADYVSYCHAHNIEVWGLVSNLEVKGADAEKVLSTTTYRENLVSALIAKAIEYKLDGINVDIEALKPSVGDGYIQFIRELSLKCHANDLILSVDNYVPTNYTAFYNRKEQADFADYVVIMAYDEHYAGSEAGSVSSIGFVKDGVKNTLKSVPKDQIILGLPFYTRVWELTPKEKDGKTTYETSSQAVGMAQAANMVKVNGATPKWDAGVAQDFAEYENGGKKYQIWLENAASLEEKLKVEQENGLAGVSFWKLGFEDGTAWNTIIKYIH